MPSSIVRQPRFWLNVGGGNINVLDCHVTLVRASHPGEFEATMALDDPSNPGAAYWSDTSPIEASVIATDGVNTKTLISGGLYKIDVDFTHRIVRVEGRDATQDMIDTRNDQKYQNQTTSQIVSAIAAKHGLSVHIDGGNDMAGRTFNNQEYAFNSDAESDWDVIQACAEQDGKIAFVNGNTLYYVNQGNTTGSDYVVTYTPPTPEEFETSSEMKLSCSRDVQIGMGVQAQAASWNTRDKQAYTSESSSS